VSSGFMICWRHEITQISAFGISDTIPHRVDHEVQTKNPEQRSSGVFGNETSGSKEVLSGLGI